jgi:linoleoyl-CoA desaturase
MSEKKFNPIKFVPNDDRQFGVTLRKRVNAYFKEHNMSKNGDYRIWLKVIIMPLLYLVPFGLVLSGLFVDNLLIFYGLWLLMAIGLAGCGLGIMHDANHGAISKKSGVNNFIGFVINLAGGYSLNWKIQHNVLHHSFTNINGYDEDIDPSGLMRFSPHQPVKSFYRYQVFYAWFLYGLMTFSWATFKDFLQLVRYNKKGLVEAQGFKYKREMLKMIALKLMYYAIFMVTPILILDIAWYHIVLSWFCMHFLAGLILACIFQPAHVVPTSEFPLPDHEYKVVGDKAIHQLRTTANFAPKNRLLSWYVGGLNYQIEHHLFPTMSHVHHKKVSKIVEATAKEFGLPYHSQRTFTGALINHARMLYQLRK